MSRSLRVTKKNNIVIVCEGSDTEPNYLSDLKQYVKDRFDDVRIVPFGPEAKEAMLRDKSLKKSRKNRQTHSPAGTRSGKYYWTLEEVDEETYNKYNQQPTRYVREAQLYLENGYVEAWAVYDFDKFPDHENAIALAKSDPRLNIAFSSVSFEEWMLLHFERNSKAFDRSCCKENKKDIGCGDHVSKHERDCHGEVCVAGYLREMNYIPDFSKSKTDLFSRYSKDRLTIARINAAWVRTLYKSDIKVYEKNPYTDFDRLVERLLDLKDRFIWIGNAGNASVGKISVDILRDSDSDDMSIKNLSEGILICEWAILDSMGNVKSDFEKIVLNHNESISLTCREDQYLVIDYDFTKYVITK